MKNESEFYKVSDYLDRTYRKSLIFVKNKIKEREKMETEERKNERTNYDWYIREAWNEEIF